jgi:S-adenosylmethionine-diacylglycerol 3-amino-3-carboxypropyl transferase
MLAPRYSPDAWSDRIIRLRDLGDSLLLKDKAFFYSAFIVEEVQ